MPVLPLPTPPPPPEGTIEVCASCGRPWLPADDLVVKLLAEIESLRGQLGKPVWKPKQDND